MFLAIKAECGNRKFSPFTRGGAMFSKSTLFKVVILLVLIVLSISIAFGTLVFADGGGGQPFPPDKSSSPNGDVGGNLLAIALLTTLQYIV
jgi:hypothetical protein